MGGSGPRLARFGAGLGGALMALMALHVFMVCARVQLQPYRNLSQDHFLVRLSFYGVIVFSLQAWCMALVGVYHGLVEVSSMRACVVVIWKLGLLPWLLLFFLTLVFLEAARPPWMFLPRLNESIVPGSGAGWHILVCGAFLVWEKWRLHHPFRGLAVQPSRRGWHRWLPFARRWG